MVSEVAETLKVDGHTSDNIYHEDFTLAAKPEPIWKSILFEGNVPGIMQLHIILIYL